MTTKIIGGLFSVLLLAGSGTVAWIFADQREMKREQAADREKAAADRGSIKVIEEKVRRLEQDTSEIKRSQEVQTEKLNELLRRVR